MQEVIYTVPELAKLFKTNVDYIHKLRKAGLLKFMKLGSYKVRKVEVDNFLAKYEGKDLTDPFNIKDLGDLNEAI